MVDNLFEIITRMPKTIGSDFSQRNCSLSHSQEPALPRRKRIDKKKKETQRRPVRKNILPMRRRSSKMVYSPEYAIQVHEVTPLYHSDEYEPCCSGEAGTQEQCEIRSYIDLEMLLRMYKEESDERVLVQQMRDFQISPKHDSITAE